ncbi:hypothetical protein [Bradyrhizobium icense]|uniref:hypothetical protein n=1 Tax=Bradyrhizobium icense TaxID=1274631 RepID=UPI0018D3428B|nr:hypothetical protein [Bradyrhizobium icense]
MKIAVKRYAYFDPAKDERRRVAKWHDVLPTLDIEGGAGFVPARRGGMLTASRGTMSRPKQPGQFYTSALAFKQKHAHAIAIQNSREAAVVATSAPRAWTLTLPHGLNPA